MHHNHEYVDQALGDRFELVMPLLWELRANFEHVHNSLGNRLELVVPLAACVFLSTSRVYLRLLACVLRRGALAFLPRRTSSRFAPPPLALAVALGRAKGSSSAERASTWRRPDWANG